MSKLTAGQFFPNFTVDTLYGGTQLIRDMLGADKTVFWCLRYIGCTVCRYDHHVMAQRYGEIEAKGAKVYFLLAKLKRASSRRSFPASRSRSTSSVTRR